MISFKEFLEDVSAGAFLSNSGHEITSANGNTYPQITLEFPTVTKTGEVFRVNVHGANYRIQITGGVTVLIPRELYHKKYDRLPKTKTKSRPGDTVTAVFYKYKSRDENNYKLKDFRLDVNR